mmetsp:Transcript_57253/g.185453  ORF Transcript_57253/g.185453 Transcript_57253/m.185453 type:complete len:105 (-) Transcript_57253:64-378(-)
MPPEVCDGGPHEPPSDCWALGVLLYQLCSLSLPFPGGNALAVVMRILEGKPRPLPSRYSRDLRELCVGLLHSDSVFRLSAACALACPALRGIASGVVCAEGEPR